MEDGVHLATSGGAHQRLTARFSVSMRLKREQSLFDEDISPDSPGSADSCATGRGINGGLQGIQLLRIAMKSEAWSTPESSRMAWHFTSGPDAELMECSQGDARLDSSTDLNHPVAAQSPGATLSAPRDGFVVEMPGQPFAVTRSDLHSPCRKRRRFRP